MACRDRRKNSNIAVVLTANGSGFVAGGRPPEREFFSPKMTVNGANPGSPSWPGFVPAIHVFTLDTWLLTSS
jgi:hypothetical protein